MYNCPNSAIVHLSTLNGLCRVAPFSKQNALQKSLYRVTAIKDKQLVFALYLKGNCVF